jgi:hypothetical protein
VAQLRINEALELTALGQPVPSQVVRARERLHSFAGSLLLEAFSGYHSIVCSTKHYLVHNSIYSIVFVCIARPSTIPICMTYP